LNLKNILFVDDEERILSGFRRSFHDKINEWKMDFVDSGSKAMISLEKRKYNVIISDMRMPNMDGAELLRKVKSVHPDTIRIVLSGQTELEMAIRTVDVAHQFLTKPCEAKHLEDVIKRACSLQDILKNEFAINLVGKIDKLPSMPKTFQALSKALSNHNVFTDDITSIIENDIAVTAKILQLANSAFFSLPKRITDISQAVNFIGINTLKNLTFSEGTFNALEVDSSTLLQIEQLHKDSYLSAKVAKNMIMDTNQSEDAYIAGLLHDIGRLIFMVYLPKEYKKALQMAQKNNLELDIVEKRIFGVTHSQIGAYLLGIWGIPYNIVEAVAYQNDPTKIEQKSFDILSALYVTNGLLENKTLNMNYLKSIGVAHLLPQWQTMVQSIKHSNVKGTSYERYD
jgi:HD-like signal output (HDOD) protein